jgi:hypothetical protein
MIPVLTLVVLIVLLLHKPAATTEAEDPRLAQMLAADLPAQFILSVSENGYGKRTDVDAYRLQTPCSSARRADGLVQTPMATPILRDCWFTRFQSPRRAISLSLILVFIEGGG